MTDFLDIDIDERSMDELLAIVEGTEIYSQSLVKAINRTLTATRTASSKNIRQAYSIKAGDIRRSFRLTRARKGRTEGLALSAGSPIPLSRFGARQTGKGVSVGVRRDRGRTTIRGAFKGQGSLPSTRVFRRTGESKRPPRKGRYKGTNVLREPIEQLFGLSVPQMLGDLGVQEGVLKRAEEVYINTLDNELRFRMQRLQDEGRRAAGLGARLSARAA